MPLTHRPLQVSLLRAHALLPLMGWDTGFVCASVLSCSGLHSRNAASNGFVGRVRGAIGPDGPTRGQTVLHGTDMTARSYTTLRSHRAQPLVWESNRPTRICRWTGCPASTRRRVITWCMPPCGAGGFRACGPPRAPPSCLRPVRGCLRWAAGVCPWGHRARWPAARRPRPPRWGS